MRIAVCDDDLQFCKLIKDNIYEYSNNHNWEPVVDVYYSGEEIVNSPIKYDIIFMDYQMNGIDGLETAKRLRKGVNVQSCIIFLTNFPQIAISAYEVDTYRFVIKGTLFDGLFRALDDYRRTVSYKTKIIIRTEHTKLIVSTDKIVFFESMNKLVLLHMSDGSTVKTRCTLSELYDSVPHNSFAKTHKSFVVNYKYVKCETERSVVLYGTNQELPLSRSFAKSFKNKFVNYLKDCI